MNKKWMVLIAASLGFFLVNFDGSTISILLPTLQDVFRAEFIQVQWIWLAGLITLVVTLAIAGRLGDTQGKKTVYMAGSLAYLVGSILMALAPSVTMMTIFRIIQAFGLTAFLALGTALVTEAFEEKKRGLALGLFNLFGLIGILAGPIAAGALLASLTWNLVFWIEAALALVVLVVSYFFLPKTQNRTKAQLDIPGILLMLVALGTLVYALTIGQTIGFFNWLVIVLLVIGLVSLVLFVRVEKTAEQPIIVIDTFKNPVFSVNLLILLLAMIALNGYGFLMPFYLQNVLGLSTIEMGLILAGIFGFVMALTAPIGGAISDKVGVSRVTLIGMLLLFIGTLTAVWLNEFSTQISVFLRFLPIGVGIGLLITPTTSAVMGTLPGDRLGMGGSIVNLTINLASTLGIAILGSFWSGRVRTLVGELPLGGASSAPPTEQALALQSTFLLALVIIALGLALNFWLILKKSAASSQNF